MYLTCLNTSMRLVADQLLTYFAHDREIAPAFLSLPYLAQCLMSSETNRSCLNINTAFGPIKLLCLSSDEKVHRRLRRSAKSAQVRILIVPPWHPRLS